MHEFVQCDATLIKNVHATTNALSARLQKVNFLILSPGLFRVSGRHDTTEGIDEQLVLSYYARWTFAYDLMPLLVRAKDAGEDAKVMSVLAAGLPMGVQADLKDLGMKNSWVSAMRVAPTYNDLMFEVGFWLVTETRYSPYLLSTEIFCAQSVLVIYAYTSWSRTYALPFAQSKPPRPNPLHSALALRCLAVRVCGIHVVHAA
jgi:hypothetical protein